MSEGGLEAVVWDMDGVIVDTAPYHFKAWQAVFEKRGVSFTEEDFKHSFGQRNDTIINDAIGRSLSPAEVNAIASEKEADFRRRLGREIKPLSGVMELINSLSGHGVKMAIASSAPIENIELVTWGLDIGDCFQAVVWSDEVTEGKPSPQGFLLAALRLGVKPGNCVVIEDAVAGVTAAKRAGMKCLAVTNTHPGEKLAEADLVVDTLGVIGVNELDSLFSS